MLNSARNCFSNGLWKLSFIGILMLGFAVASLAPYRSIIGIERLGLSEIEFALYTTISAIATRSPRRRALFNCASKLALMS